MTSLRSRLARVHPLVWIAVVAVAGGLIAWPLGGWDTVELESTEIPQVEPGVVVPGHEYSVEVDSAEVTGVHPDGFSEADAGWEWLVLTVGVTNETDNTDFSIYLGDGFFGIVTIDDSALGWGTTALDPDGYDVASQNYLEADGTLNPDLQPRLPSTVIMVFPVRVGDYHAGDVIHVGIVDRTPYERTLSTGTGYKDPTVVATVDLTVGQGAVAPAPEPEVSP